MSALLKKTEVVKIRRPPNPAGIGVLAAVIACTAGGPLFAQIDLSLAVEPRQALLHEPVNARVSVRNNTGAVLGFDSGADAARFYFEIRRDRDEAVDQLDHAPLLYGTKLVPAGHLTNGFCLTSLFSMCRRGAYQVKACIEWNNTLFASPAVNLEMLKGFEIARMIAGLPGEPGAMRLYRLEYLPKNNGEYVYLSIADEQSGKIYGMFNLGRIIRVRKPEMKVDEAGNIHVLFQSTAMVFYHIAFTPYGVRLFARNYADKSNQISLVYMPNGQISVPAGYSDMKSAAGDDNPPASAPGGGNAPPPGQGPRPGRGGLFGSKTE